MKLFPYDYNVMIKLDFYGMLLLFDSTQYIIGWLRYIRDIDNLIELYYVIGIEIAITKNNIEFHPFKRFSQLIDKPIRF